MKIHRISLSLLGRTHVHWTETHPGPGNQPQSVPYTSNEVYCEGTIALWDSGEKKTETLDAGTHSFPFKFLLPRKCPSSFEGGHTGHVRYQIRAVIERPWKFDHVTKKVFTLSGYYDLNDDENSRSSSSAVASKQVGHLCWKAGDISVSIRVPKSGFVSGEFVPLKPEISNNTSRRITRVLAQMVQKVTFTGKRFETADEKKKVETHVVGKMEEKVDLGPKSELSGKLFFLQVPPLPPSNLGSKAISIEYHIQIHVVPKGVTRHLVAELPISIGVIPLKNRSFFEVSDQIDSPEAQSNDSEAPAKPRRIRKESVLGRQSTVEETDTKFMLGDTEFTPTYDFYTMEAVD